MLSVQDAPHFPNRPRSQSAGELVELNIRHYIPVRTEENQFGIALKDMTLQTEQNRTETDRIDTTIEAGTKNCRPQCNYC